MAEQPRLVAVYGFSFDENQREFWQILGLEHMLDDSESDDETDSDAECESESGSDEDNDSDTESDSDTEQDQTKNLSDERRAILKFLKDAPFDFEETHLLPLSAKDQSAELRVIPARDRHLRFMRTCIRASFSCNDFYDDDEPVKCIVGTEVDTSFDCITPAGIEKAEKNLRSGLSSNSMINKLCFTYSPMIHFTFSTNTYGWNS